MQYAGIGGVLGGIALAGAYMMHPPLASPEVVSGELRLWVHIGFMISLLCGIFLLIALLARYFQSNGGILGFVGFALSLVSLVFVFGLDYAEVFIFPTLAVEFPTVVATYGDGTMMPSIAFAFPLTGLCFPVGFLLFSWQLYITGTVKRQASLLTAVGTVVFGVGRAGSFR